MPIAPLKIVCLQIIYFLVRDRVEIERVSDKNREGFIERKRQRKKKKENVGCAHAKISHNFFYRYF